MMEFLDSFNILSKQIFDVCGFQYSQPEQEAESGEYQACHFRVNNKSVYYRHAKITPKKIGQFVTIWRRDGKNPIQPYDISDDIDLLVITVKTKKHFGQFVFPKMALVQQRVLSVKGQGGKRAIRVYPPWDKTENKQAQKTQKWQLKFFAEIPKNKKIDIQKFKALYSA